MNTSTTRRHVAPMATTRRVRAYKPYRPMFAPDPLNAVADSWRTPRPSKSPMVASLGLPCWNALRVAA